jgi:dolichol kinase
MSDSHCSVSTKCRQKVHVPYSGTMANDAVLGGAFFFVLIVAFQVVVARFSLEKEAKRRWQHAITGHAMVVVSYLLPMSVCIASLFLGAVGIYCLQHYRKDVYIKAFGELLRPEELEDGRMPGAFYFLLGTALTTSAFPQATARYAVECLSLADPMAAWIGRSIQSPMIHKSASLAGCLACLCTAWLVGWIFLRDTASLAQITAGAVACCIAEALTFGNDNLLIPIVTAAAVHGMR